MKTSKKIVTSVAALVVATIAATSATFAWFTMGNAATVDQVQVGVTSGKDALKISAGDADDYKTSLSTDELLTANGYKQATYDSKTELFKKVTTTITEDTTDVTGFYTIAASDSTFTATKASGTAKKDTLYYQLIKLDAITSTDGASFKKEDGTATTDNYISLKISFRSSAAADQNIYLLNISGDSAVAKKDEKTSSIDTATGATLSKTPYTGATLEDAVKYGKKITKGAGIDTRAAYASRVGFVGTVAAASDTKNVWAPYDYDTYTNGCVETEQASKTSVSYWKGNIAADYKAAFESKDGAWPTTASTETGKKNDVVAQDSLDTKNAGATVLTKLTQNSTTSYYEGSLTINIWLEGKDGDCLNSILEDYFSVKMAFVALSSAA